ncbi:MAG TPA: amidohydrolase family protein [Burkholderiaceae bacterium]|nr:amidohydrolase family protein [Burkholderiaceae bacterium]
MSSAASDAPARGWDCHAHVFGPYARFALSAARSYTPPEAPIEDYLGLLARLRLAHGLLVQPSAYGDDHALLFEALAAQPALRGVIVARLERLPTPGTLRARGVRAARYSHRSGAGANFAGSASFDDLLQMAPALADAGLHAELWTDCRALPAIAAAIVELPVPVVIDHMGGFDVASGVGDPGFACLLSLVSSGHAWVKLCAYRNLQGAADFESGKVFHDALLRANPQRLLWGSDWPHLRVTPAPDAATLLDTFKRWTASDALVAQILERNPALLYL